MWVPDMHILQRSVVLCYQISGTARDEIIVSNAAQAAEVPWDLDVMKPYVLVNKQRAYF